MFHNPVGMLIFDLGPCMGTHKFSKTDPHAMTSTDPTVS